MVLFPVLLMLFALAMERVEFRLSRLTVREQEVQEFLDHADSTDVANLAEGSMPEALNRFHLRRSKSPATGQGVLSARKAS